jgi:viroplasmin and RNaseH domain-containing protein
MSVDDAKAILKGNEHAATEYFQKNTTDSLKEMIKPIIEETMQENDVVKYYDIFSEYYGENAKNFMEDNSLMEMAKGFGADEYLPSSSDENLDDYVTEQAISGLFKMLASKEAEIRKDPLAQTSSLLKEVFGK